LSIVRNIFASDHLHLGTLFDRLGLLADGHRLEQGRWTVPSFDILLDVLPRILASHELIVHVDGLLPALRPARLQHYLLDFGGILCLFGLLDLGLGLGLRGLTLKLATGLLWITIAAFSLLYRFLLQIFKIHRIRDWIQIPFNFNNDCYSNIAYLAQSQDLDSH